MRTDKASISEISDAELDQLIMSEYPYPIAVNYRRLLECEGWEARTRKCIEVFEYGLRAIAPGVLSQYLIRDVHQVSDLELDRKLHRHLAKATLGQWVEFFFLSLRAYRGQRQLFFMPELYDLYWDTSREPHQYRKGVQAPFQGLVKIRNDLAHRPAPKNEEAWEELGRKALAHLRTILGQFNFLRHYDLIRVVGRHKDEYEYECYTGQKITVQRGHMQEKGKKEELRRDWFYLSRQDRLILRLHPLLIFWTVEGEPGLAEERLGDVAVYDWLAKEAVNYVATVMQEMVEKRDAELIAQLRELIFYNIEHVKMARERTVLSWAGLRQAAEELSAAQMGAVREKYRRELYLQRGEIFRKLQEFLTSNKGCFVLTGKSGVGKSNFVLSLADEYAEREDVGLVMYNGARLNVSKTMVGTISQDMAEYLTLEGEASRNLFAELDRQGEMGGKTLVVVFDAINENVDGKALLRRIDQMVGEVTYPWLKVVITSRPQAWRTLKRGLRLAEEHYYHEQGTDEYWVELQEFTVQMKPFERRELPEVYEKYREAYKLQSDYEVLKAPIRSALRDPLKLRLVAEIYRGQAIPERIRVSDIYDQYVQALLRTERLYEEDVILLEQELMPLMISEGHFDNKLTASQIHTAKTRDGRSLWELIRNDDQLSIGRRINDSYVRLVDAEILTEQGPPTDYEITFKYERFYDHYAGKRMIDLVDPRGDAREAIYRELVALLQAHPFLWGPIKTALMEELRRDNTKLFIDLAQIPDDATRQLLVTALSEIGHDDPKKVRLILETLVGLEEAGGDQRVRRRGHREEISAPLLNARKVAVETASNIEMGEILVQAGCDPSASVRIHAAQCIQHLWNQNNRASLETLTSLSERIKNRLGVPIPAVLETLIGASALIAFAHYRDAEMMQSLQQLWRGILDQLLFIGKSETGATGHLRRRLWGVALSVVIRSLVGFTGLLLSGGYLNYEELDHFFHLDPEEKRRFQTLLPYLDASYGDMEDIRDDLMALAATRDILTMHLVYFTFGVRGVERFEEIAPLIQPLSDQVIDLEPPGPMTIGVLGAVRTITMLTTQSDNRPDEALDLLDKLVWEHYERSNFVYWTDVKAYQHGTIDGLIIAHYLWRGTYYPDSLLEHLKKDKDLEQFTLHRLFVEPTADSSVELDQTLGILDAITSYGYPTLALKCAELLLEVKDEVTRKGLYRFLARLRTRDQYAVDDFIEEFRLNADEIRQIDVSTSTQTIGEVLAITALPFLLELQSQPPVFREVHALLTGMLECRSVTQLVELLVKRVVNFIYGSAVFDIP
jgi:hypothetical protein